MQPVMIVGACVGKSGGGNMAVDWAAAHARQVHLLASGVARLITTRLASCVELMRLFECCAQVTYLVLCAPAVPSTLDAARVLQLTMPVWLGWARDDPVIPFDRSRLFESAPRLEFHPVS